jgi:hypothetical protein
MNYLAANYGTILNILGSVFEIMGVILMANRFIKVKAWQIPAVIVSSLWRGKLSLRAASFAELTEDNALETLRGLSFIAVGFVIGALPNVIKLFT